MKPVYRFVCLFLLFGLSAPGAISSAITEAEADFNEGKALAKKRQFKKAIPFFDHAAKLAPNVAVIYAERGSAYLNLEQIEPAFADLSRAIKLAPTLCQPYADRARCEYEKHNCRAAIDDMSHAIPLASDKVDRAFKIRERATYYLDLGDSKNALVDVNKSLTIFPDFYTYFLRADMHCRLKQYKEAVADYTTGLKLVKPNTIDLDFWYEQRARAYDKLGETKLAAKDREQSRQSNLKDPYYKLLGPSEKGGWELPSGLGKPHQ